jgi:hypothetical protein
LSAACFTSFFLALHYYRFAAVIGRLLVFHVLILETDSRILCCCMGEMNMMRDPTGKAVLRLSVGSQYSSFRGLFLKAGKLRGTVMIQVDSMNAQVMFVCHE